MTQEHKSSIEFFIPKEQLGLVNFLYKEGEVLERKDGAQGSYLTVNLSNKAEQVFRSKLTK